MFDLLIIGAGPAGLAASIYASRYRLKHLVIGKEIGGQINLALKVENFPGFGPGTGREWVEKTVEQVRKLDGEIAEEMVGRIEMEQLASCLRRRNLRVGRTFLSGNQKRKENQGLNVRLESRTYADEFKIFTESGKKYKARTLIVATGMERRKLGVPGEKELIGRGVSYCAICDAGFFRGKTAAVIGGADSACMAAVHLSKFAKKVYIIYRKPELRGEPVWRERVEKLVGKGKVEIIYNMNVVEIKSQIPSTKFQASNSKPDKVRGVELDGEYKGEKFLAVDGVFIEAGGVPTVALVKPLGVKLDKREHIAVNELMETSAPGIFAAGDVTDISGRVMMQMITACSQGAVAAQSAYKYVSKKLTKNKK